MLRENKTSICNKALSLLGESGINSIDDDTTLQARTCRQYFDLALHTVLESGCWSHVTAEEKMDRVLFRNYSEEQKYVYRIPNDCALIIRVYERFERKQLPNKLDWDLRYISELNDTFVVCDRENRDKDKDDDVMIEYVKVAKNFSAYSALFVNTLVSCLAYMMCMDITKDTQKMNLMMQLYQLNEAKALQKSLNEDGQDRMNWTDPITASRG